MNRFEIYVRGKFIKLDDWMDMGGVRIEPE